jgi:hypothetical protein
MADNQKNIRRCLINVFVKLKHRQKTTVQKICLQGQLRTATPIYYTLGC